AGATPVARAGGWRRDFPRWRGCIAFGRRTGSVTRRFRATSSYEMPVEMLVQHTVKRRPRILRQPRAGSSQPQAERLKGFGIRYARHAPKRARQVATGLDIDDALGDLALVQAQRAQLDLERLGDVGEAFTDAVPSGVELRGRGK